MSLWHAGELQRMVATQFASFGKNRIPFIELLFPSRVHSGPQTELFSHARQSVSRLETDSRWRIFLHSFCQTL